MRTLPFLLLAVAVQATAQLATTFPADSTPVNAETFKEKFTGGSYQGVRADGMSFRMDFAQDGGLIIMSRGNSDNGKWRFDGDKLCQDMFRSDSSCNEVRVQEGVLYYKRLANGEVLTLKRR